MQRLEFSGDQNQSGIGGKISANFEIMMGNADQLGFNIDNKKNIIKQEV